jgi:hypothetical protein
MKKALFGLAALLALAMVFTSCDNAAAKDGIPGDTILSGYVSEAAARYALASGKPVVFAGAEVNSTGASGGGDLSAPLVIDRAVTLIANSPALTVSGTLVVGANASFSRPAGTSGKISATVIVAPEKFVTASTADNVIDSTSGTVVPASTSGTIDTTGGNIAVVGNVTISSADTSATNILNTALSGKNLYVIGNLTVSAAVTATNIGVTGDITATESITGSVIAGGNFSSAETGAAAVIGTLSVGGNATFTGEAAKIGGATTVGGNITFTGDLEILTSSGLTVSAGKTLTIPADKTLAVATGNGTLTVEGTLVVNGTGTVNGTAIFANTATITGAGTLNVTTTGTFRNLRNGGEGTALYAPGFTGKIVLVPGANVYAGFDGSNVPHHLFGAVTDQATNKHNDSGGKKVNAWLTTGTVEITYGNITFNGTVSTMDFVVSPHETLHVKGTLIVKGQLTLRVGSAVTVYTGGTVKGSNVSDYGWISNGVYGQAPGGTITGLKADGTYDEGNTNINDATSTGAMYHWNGSNAWVKSNG